MKSLPDLGTNQGEVMFPKDWGLPLRDEESLRCKVKILGIKRSGSGEVGAQPQKGRWKIQVGDSGKEPRNFQQTALSVSSSHFGV